MSRLFSFSERTNWELGENPLAQALTELRSSGAEIFDLTESNPTRCGFSYPPEMFLSPLASTDNLFYAPHPKGMLRARQAISDYYAARRASVDPERLVLTSATSEAYSFLFRMLFEPGDRVLVPAPSYPLFSYLAGLNDVEVDHYPITLRDGAWAIDTVSLESSVKTITRAVILVSPNNPTGSCVKTAELAALNAIASRHGLSLICDEVFSDYIFGTNPDICPTLAENSGVPTFVLSGLSKALALPQMKLSWIAANGPEPILRQSLDRLEVIADTYLSVNTPVQNACAAWLPGSAAIRDQVLARVKENFAFLKEAVGSDGKGNVLPVEGGWYAVLRVDLDDPEDEWAVRLLRERRVYVHPGFYFDFEDEGNIVLSLLPPPERFREGVQRMLAALSGS